MDVTFPVLDVRKLIMLEAVAAEGSIAAAARRLQYTRSAVSQQVSALEAEAGTALIDRTGNRVTLTPAGRALVEHAERILVELRSAEATLAGAGTRITGLLRVGIPFREGPHIMSRALTEIRRRFPDMEIRLAAVSDEEGPDAVHRDQLDMAIVSRYGNARDAGTPGLREWTLGHDPLRLVVPPGHPLAGVTSCAMNELAGEAWVMCPGTSLGRLVRSLCIAAGFQPRVGATVHDIGTAISLVGIGWGITIAPELTPAGTPAKVTRLPIAGVDTNRYSVLIVRDGEHLSPRIAAAISAVRSVSAELRSTAPSALSPREDAYRSRPSDSGRTRHMTATHPAIARSSWFPWRYPQAHGHQAREVI
jgi:DNA-binding transcriptional LysR family regulator